MDETFAELEQKASPSALLGYLNFSDGRPDSRWQRQLDEAYRWFAGRGEPEPWRPLAAWLARRLEELHAAGAAAFRDASQATAVLRLAFDGVPAAYRAHHANLLFHQADRDLFPPCFLARACEAVLAQGAPWDDESRIVAGALMKLNDFVGHRPVAILETRPRGEPYDHERVRPVPLYLAGAGVGFGPYEALVTRALDILRATDAGILAEAGFDPALLEELAFDPRAYDHGHPVNRRPNYAFGEWDPHHLDNQGRYRRYVARQITLDGLLERTRQPGGNAEELLREAAAVFAGTVLMAAGTSGAGPTALDSSATLATLVPKIARYRDAFYADLLEHGAARFGFTEAHRARLQQEAQATRQPFGGARQHLNHFLARHRAAQLQQRHLALLFAEMGCPEAGRRHAARIPAAGVRLLTEMLGGLRAGHVHAGRGEFAAAAQALGDVERLLHCGITCGALADPWNILGFQGLFPLSSAREDSVRDTRVDELVQMVEQTFSLYARLLSETAATGANELRATLRKGMKKLAAWWDRFASVEVSDVRRVHGGEAAASAEHVATALARWHEQGEKTADLAFWRGHLDQFRSPKAFALVVDALLKKADHKAALALLINWLGQAEQVPLEDGEHSFHLLAVRWLLEVLNGETPGTQYSVLRTPYSAETWPLVKKFFAYLESNAEEYWEVPRLDLLDGAEEREDEDEEDELFEAAYEGVTFRDSADDDHEGAVIDGAEPQRTFDLEEEVPRLEKRLRFLSTVARLWQVAARRLRPLPAEGEPRELAQLWLDRARANEKELLHLLHAVHGVAVPEPGGSYDSLVEYDRRRLLKEQLLEAIITTCLDAHLAGRSLRGSLTAWEEEPQAAIAVLAAELRNQGSTLSEPQIEWEPRFLWLDHALLHGRPALAREVLPLFLRYFRQEPLLYVSLASGGHPRRVLQVRLAQRTLRALLEDLPRLGLLRETFYLLKTARQTEQEDQTTGKRVSEFDRLFQAAFHASVDSLAEAAGELAVRPREFIDLLRQIIAPFVAVWDAHSRTLQLSTLDTLHGDQEWQAVRDFVRRYGGDLFHARFMTLANLRGVLHRGVGAYLDYLRENADPLHPVRLLDDLGTRLARPEAERRLQAVLQAVVENYEEYKDYNTTTTQSDYGENLHVLLDFLKLKTSYERHAWRFRPLLQTHEILARRGLNDAALLWEDAFLRYTRDLAEQHLGELARLEQAHGVRLRSVADRLQERFVKPLALDRLCALIGPVLAEVEQAGDGAALARLERELEPHAQEPTGAGLDVPHWLRRLEAEVQRVRTARSAVAQLAEEFFRVPRLRLTQADLLEQLRRWEEPLLGNDK